MGKESQAAHNNSSRADDEEEYSSLSEGKRRIKDTHSTCRSQKTSADPFQQVGIAPVSSPDNCHGKKRGKNGYKDGRRHTGCFKNGKGCRHKHNKRRKTSEGSQPVPFDTHPGKQDSVNGKNDKKQNP